MKLDSSPISLTATSIPISPSQQPEIENIECYSESTFENLHQASPQEPQANTKKTQSPIFIFGSTFITIFLAEIGDKTQLSTLLMSAESHSPWVVFIGSGAALVTTSFLGVALGSVISKYLSPKTVNKAAGVTLLLISLMLFLDLILA